MCGASAPTPPPPAPPTPPNTGAPVVAQTIVEGPPGSLARSAAGADDPRNRQPGTLGGGSAAAGGPTAKTLLGG